MMQWQDLPQDVIQLLVRANNSKHLIYTILLTEGYKFKDRVFQDTEFLILDFQFTKPMMTHLAPSVDHLAT